MTKISVLFLFTCIFFNCDIRAKSLVGEMENERKIRQDEIASQEPIFENSRYPMGYAERSGLMYDTSNYRTNAMKRSLGEHKPSQRQTGIIYGGGKPIGILQPYQESFKFMPIKEERVYSLDGGRSNIDQQEPYINLMYPLARFARSEEAIRMAELEAAKAEFLDKHYPSMLVDFKIHNKLHPTGYNVKSIPTFNIKREETNPTNNEIRKKKRDSQNPSISKQKLHKRANQYIQKRDSLIYKKQPQQISTLQKREDKPLHERKEKSTAKIQRQDTGSEYQTEVHNKLKKKRQSKLTDTQFENLKNSVSRRNSNENIQVMEEDLKGLLSDMGLIEDDLEENAEGIEENQSAVVQDEDLQVGFDTIIQKEKEEPLEEQKGGNLQSPERKKRAGGNKLVGQTHIPLSSKRKTDLKKRTLNDSPNKRSLPEARDTGKRLIEVSFSTKESKEALNGNANERDSCSKPSVIPNKREIMDDRSSGNKRERSAPKEETAESKRSEHASVTTETYEQYEQRVAREIKNKINQLKEEVRRELGALESDKDEEDDDECLGESQRKKRFIMNTLMDEESHNIDPNENLENAELEPHVRRRRTLSTDLMSSFSSQKSPLKSYEKSKGVNMINYDPMSVSQTKFDFDVYGFYGELDGRGYPFTNQEPYRNDAITLHDGLHANYHPISPNYRWNDSPMYLRAAAKMYVPEYQRQNPGKYVAFSSRRNSRNDPNSPGGNYNSDYDDDVSNSKSEEEADVILDSVVDVTSKSVERKDEHRQQFRTNDKHAPKKLQGYNQKHFYYYVGRNENAKKDNVVPSSTDDERLNPMNNYQRLTGNYPNQGYKTINPIQGKQYKGVTENGLSNQRAFQRRFDKPFGRRRKRYVNFMISPSSREGAIVTKGFTRNSSIPHYPRFNTQTGNPEVYNIFREAMDDGVRRDLWNMTSGTPVKEKGKKTARIEDELSRRNALIPWNPKVYEGGTLKSQAGSSHSVQDSEGNPLKYLHNSDSKMNTMQQIEERDNILQNTQVTNKPEQKSKGHLEEGKFSGRKMLYWRVHENSQVNRDKAQILSDSKVNSNRNSNGMNSLGLPKDNFLNEMSDYQRESEEEAYDENYYSDSIVTSTFGSTEKLLETTSRKNEDSTMDHAENSNEIRISDVNAQRDYSHKNGSGPNIRSDTDIITDSEIDTNNFFVQNESLPSAEWKRRKRNVQPQYHEAVRQKRYWLWPTLSFLRNNAPRVEEEGEFNQNGPYTFQDRRRSSDRSSLSFDDDVEADSEDFANNPGSYDRNKRNTESRSIFSRNKSPYLYASTGSRSSYIPVSRKRRFKELPQQLLTEISDSELFGALPQGYAGELARYKRVKRLDMGADVT